MPSPLVWGKGGIPYRAGLDPDAAAYIARMSPTPSAGRQTIINNFFAGLKSDGLYNGLDAMWSIANTAQVNGFLNMKSTNNTITLVGSQETFTTDRGYDTANIANALNSNWTASVDGVNYTQNSASMGVYMNQTASAFAGAAMGTASGSVTHVYPRSATSTGGGQINAAGGFVGTATDVTTMIGLSAMNRSGSSASQFIKDGIDQTDIGGGAASVAIPTVPFYLLSRNANPGTNDTLTGHRIAFAFVGGSMTIPQHLAFYNRVVAYLAAIGAS